jgi:hypothetical protein
MSRSNLDKPFYVDVGTSIVAVRCASNHDVVLEYDHSRHPFVIELAEKACDRMNREAEIGRPRRNCDRFATADEAFHAWNNTVDTPGGGAYVGLMDWLYAPATEKEGGNDAD